MDTAMTIKQVLILRTDLKLDTQSVNLRPASPLAAHLPSYFEQYEWVLNLKQERNYACVSDESTLLAKFLEASDQGIPCALFKDKGITRRGAVETCTLLVIGPAEAASVDAITGELPVLCVEDDFSV